MDGLQNAIHFSDGTWPERLTITGNPKLQSLHGLEGYKILHSSVYIEDNATLSDISALSNLDSVYGSWNFSLELHNNPLLNDCDLLCRLHEEHRVEGGIHVSNNGRYCSGLDTILAICAGDIIRMDTTTALLPPPGTELPMRFAPNPVVDELRIEAEGIPELLLALYRFDGHLLHQSRQSQTARIDFSGFAAGFYVVEVRDGKGRLLRRMKVVKGE